MSSKFHEFLADAEALSRVRPRGPAPCPVAELLTHLDTHDADIVTAALDRPDMTSHAISLALRQRGTRVASYLVSRHRNRLCSCDSAAD